MIKYHIVLSDELGEDYSISVRLPHYVDVVAWLSEQFPESSYVSIRIG